MSTSQDEINLVSYLEIHLLLLLFLAARTHFVWDFALGLVDDRLPGIGYPSKSQDSINEMRQGLLTKFGISRT